MADALLLLAVATGAGMLAAWLVAVRIGDVSFVDAVWGGGMALLTALALPLAERPGAAAWTVAAMTIAWGTRLAIHLFLRWRRQGEDRRYAAILAPWRERGRFALGAFLKVFAPQAVLLFLVASPAVVGVLAADGQSDLPAAAWAGVALYLLGIGFEWAGDWQLARFRADPANSGRILDNGLWRYTRHPNYFGDACAWWGIWIVAMAIDWRAAIWTVPGPLFLTFTLVRWSGAALTERGMRERHGADYADYVRRTPAFIPWFPRA